MKIIFHWYMTPCSPDCKTHLPRHRPQEATFPTLRNLCKAHSSFKQANTIIIRNCLCGPSNGTDDVIIVPDIDITWLGS